MAPLLPILVTTAALRVVHGRHAHHLADIRPQAPKLPVQVGFTEVCKAGMSLSHI